jgi:alpha-ribazole phosphatase
MQIYLIRHTAPAIENGICYGQSDIDVQSSFIQDAAKIKRLLPDQMLQVYSSPLKRCQKLSEFLFPDCEIKYCDELKEIDCGEWEEKRWDEIDETVLNGWMKDFVNVCFPGGENFLQLAARVNKIFDEICNSDKSPIAVVTHAGVIRSLLSRMANTPLEDAFSNFKISFGNVMLLERKSGNFLFRLVADNEANSMS